MTDCSVTLLPPLCDGFVGIFAGVVVLLLSSYAFACWAVHTPKLVIAPPENICNHDWRYNVKPDGSMGCHFWRCILCGAFSDLGDGEKLGIFPPENKKDDSTIEVACAPGWVRIGHATEDIPKGDVVDLEPSTGRVRRATQNKKPALSRGLLKLL